MLTPASQARGRKTDREAEVGNGAKSRTDRHGTKGPLSRFMDAMKGPRTPEGATAGVRAISGADVRTPHIRTDGPDADGVLPRPCTSPLAFASGQDLRLTLREPLRRDPLGVCDA